MIRMKRFSKVLLLFLLDLEGSELQKIKKEKIQARTEIVKIVPVDKAQSVDKPLTLDLLKTFLFYSRHFKIWILRKVNY